MDPIPDIYQIIGIKKEDAPTGEKLLAAWRRTIQIWHPSKLPYLEDRFPTLSSEELSRRASEKTLALTTIKDLVKLLAGDESKKREYDNLLENQ